ncbi:MAG: Uma2 family endonuclease [Actinomycetia bacterium]|nr:Uma2 family endonuclease [Actinomycetes bacterium]
MPAMPFDDDGPMLHPDDLKMPERAAHRQAVDLISLAAIRLLGSDIRVFRDLNWYPSDGGNAVAPDVMVLPADAVDESPRSYRQGADGASPTVVVEVPSESDSYAAFRAKALRYQGLGAVAYVVIVDSPSQTVLRLGLDDREPMTWIDRPLPELGGVRLVFDAGRLVLITPDGVRAISDDDLVADAARRADEAARRADDAARRADDAARRADDAERRADGAEERAQALARQLELLGVDPETHDQ